MFIPRGYFPLPFASPEDEEVDGDTQMHQDIEETPTDWPVSLKDEDILKTLSRDFKASTNFKGVMERLVANKIIPRHRKNDFKMDVEMILEVLTKKLLVTTRSIGRETKYVLRD